MSAVVESPWEYQQWPCDIWQIALLCNEVGNHGWEFVAMTESYDGQMVPKKVGSDDGPTYRPLKAVVVLFRRPVVAEVNE